jgi:hypothetical protein
MICFAKPALTCTYIVHKEEFSITCYMCDTCILDERPSISITDKPITSSERMLHKHYDRQGSVERVSIVSLKWLDAKIN